MAQSAAVSPPGNANVTDSPGSRMYPPMVTLGASLRTMAALLVAGVLIVTDRTTGLLGSCWAVLDTAMVS